MLEQTQNSRRSRNVIFWLDWNVLPLVSTMRWQTMELMNLLISMMPVPFISMLPKAMSECRYESRNSFRSIFLTNLTKWYLQSFNEMLLNAWDSHLVVPRFWHMLKSLVCVCGYEFH